MPGKFEGCIADALAAPDADEEERAALRGAKAIYDEAFAHAAETLSPDAADRHAGQAAMDELKAQAARKAVLRAQSIRARRRILASVAAFKRARGYDGVQDLGSGGGKPPEGGWVQGGEPPKEGPGSKGAAFARSLELLVENKPGRAAFPDASLDGRRRAIRGQFDAKMAELIEHFETRTGFDAPGRAVLDNVGREAFGEATGDPAAKGLAEAWKGVAELARTMFNAAGGDIAHRDDWHFPQAHDPVAIRHMGKPAWVEMTYPLLNRQAMTDRITGLPFTEKRLRATLSQVYDSIASGGASKRTPGEGLGRGMLANARQEERFLVFKDYQSWKAYNQAAGRGDLFGIMMGHLDEMAQDIARMQILGPNPDHQWDWLKRVAAHEAALEEAAGVEGASKKALSYTRTAQEMLDHFTGSANVPENEWLARMGSTGRAILTPAALGSAILTDAPCAPVFGAYARILTGLSKQGTPLRFLSLLSPAKSEDRALARRMGFINEQATEGLVRGAQDSLRMMTVGTRMDGRALNAFARRLPAGVFRLSLLTPWTQARKRVFRMEFLGALADRAGTGLEEMVKGSAEDQAFARTLAGYGFSPQDWDRMRAAPLWEPQAGAKFLRPTEVIDHVDQELGLRMAEMVETQARQIIPEMTLWTRAKLVGDARPGTWRGEFLRSWAMFRSFSLTAGHLYAEDLFLRGQGGKAAAIGSIAGATALMGLLTLSGATSIQLRAIVKGDDPRPMDTGAFWGAALLQGGGMGILGDLLYSAQTRAGKSSAMTGWGPVGAAGSDLWDATGGLAGDTVADMQTRHDDFQTAFDAQHPGRRAVGLARRYNPLASLWWTRTAMDRAVMDQLQKQVDPEADAAFQARAQRLRHDYGQSQWWQAGAAMPDRAPDLGAAVRPTP